MSTLCPNPWTTQDLVSMGISNKAQRRFLDDTLWAMDRVMNLKPVPSVSRSKAIEGHGDGAAERPTTSPQES